MLFMGYFSFAACKGTNNFLYLQEKIKKYAQKFAQSKKKQYLCTRFRISVKSKHFKNRRGGNTDEERRSTSRLLIKRSGNQPSRTCCDDERKGG